VSTTNVSARNFYRYCTAPLVHQQLSSHAVNVRLDSAIIWELLRCFFALSTLLVSVKNSHNFIGVKPKSLLIHQQQRQLLNPDSTDKFTSEYPAHGYSEKFSGKTLSSMEGVSVLTFAARNWRWWCMPGCNLTLICSSLCQALTYKALYKLECTLTTWFGRWGSTYRSQGYHKQGSFESR
jgi:hypothetical protein